MPYSVIVAGSTKRTRLLTAALASDPRFTITGILTPSPKPVGRKQVSTQNPMQQFAIENSIPVLLVEKKIDEHLKIQMESWQKPDFLLVVDFGYIVPNWLLSWPKIAPVNVHPSDLPKYRGSSPGQYALVFGEKTSAVSIMVMDEKLDHGPIITKIPFAIESNWTASEYYSHAFDLVAQKLGSVLSDYAKAQNSSPQPEESPTPVARMLTRDDGFVPFNTLQALMEGKVSSAQIPFLEAHHLLSTVYQFYGLWRGLTPWPGLWTLVKIGGEEKRMKLLSLHIEAEKIHLDDVQVEGKNKTSFTQLQSQLDVEGA